MPSTREMITAFSVEPNPSYTRHPKRSENAAMSFSLASLPNAIRSGLSASSARSGVART